MTGHASTSPVVPRTAAVVAALCCLAPWLIGTGLSVGAIARSWSSHGPPTMLAAVLAIALVVRARSSRRSDTIGG